MQTEEQKRGRPGNEAIRISLGTRSKDTPLYRSPSQAWNVCRAQLFHFCICWHHSLSSLSVSLFRHRGLWSKSCRVCNILQWLAKIRLLWWTLNPNSHTAQAVHVCTWTIPLFSNTPIFWLASHSSKLRSKSGLYLLNTQQL